jgi:UDP-N-acetylenolpyruvoylglucosamine reductase
VSEPVLADLTTLRVGGAATRLLTAETTDELVAHALDAFDDHEWLVLGGGSNLLVADQGFDGTVVLVRTTGSGTSETPKRFRTVTCTKRASSATCAAVAPPRFVSARVCFDEIAAREPGTA